MSREVVYIVTDLHNPRIGRIRGYAVFCNTTDKIISDELFETIEEAQDYIDLMEGSRK